VQRASRRFTAAIGCGSLHTIITITQSPNTLIKRLKAICGNSDQIRLKEQYPKNSNNGQH